MVKFLCNLLFLVINYGYLSFFLEKSSNLSSSFDSFPEMKAK